MAIRVCHVIPQIGVGGAERQLYELIVRSDPAAVVHRVLYYDDSNDTEQLALYERAGIPMARIPRNKKRPLRFIRDMAGLIRAGGADIVHCWLFSGVVWGRLGAMRAGVRPIIVAHRGTELIHLGILRTLERLTGPRVHYMANSFACARVVAGQLRVPAERFHVIYNGIDVERFSVTPDRAGVLAELGVPDDGKVVVMVGRLTRAKNYPMLLEVARRCRGTLLVRFVLVGHGELEAELRRRADELGVSDRVHFVGLRHDVERILRAADVFCFTSLHEGFPNALLEAMTAGLPIVTTGFPGAEELVEDGACGFVVPLNDADAAFARLRAYLDDPAMAARMGAAARRKAVERFSMAAMVSRTFAFYRELLEARA